MSRAVVACFRFPVMEIERGFLSLSLSYPRFDESSDDDDRSDGDGDFKVIIKKPR